MLCLASASGQLELLRSRLRNGIEVDAVEPFGGSTALHWAAYFGHKDACQMLIDAGADRASRNKAGATPLHSACECCRSSVVVYLVESCGADLTAADENGQTPIDRVVAAGRRGRMRLGWEDLLRYTLGKADAAKLDLDALASGGVSGGSGGDDAAAGGCSSGADDGGGGGSLYSSQRAAQDSLALEAARRIIAQHREAVAAMASATAPAAPLTAPCESKEADDAVSDKTAAASALAVVVATTTTATPELVAAQQGVESQAVQVAATPSGPEQKAVAALVGGETSKAVPQPEAAPFQGATIVLPQPPPPQQPPKPWWIRFLEEVSCIGFSDDSDNDGGSSVSSYSPSESFGSSTRSAPAGSTAAAAAPPRRALSTPSLSAASGGQNRE